MTLIPGIKQISQVGNDMYIQGAFPVSIVNTDVSYLSDPADIRLLAGRDPVIEEVSVGMSGSETGIKTASGAAPLQITDAMKGMLRFLETNIKSVQDLHGYVYPWPAGGGKNKLRITVDMLKALNHNGTWTGDVYDYAGITFTPIVDSSGYVVKIHVYGTRNGAPYLDLCRINTLPYDSYIINGGVTGIPVRAYHYDGTNIAASYGADVSFTSTSASGSSCFDIAVNINDTVDVDLYPMVRAANVSDPTFAPYANICPITGWTGCNVYVSPTTNQADATVYPCTWQDDAGTVYGGTIDLISGLMTVTMAEVDLGTLNWGAYNDGKSRVTTNKSVIPCVDYSTPNYPAGIISDIYPTEAYNPLITNVVHGIGIYTLGNSVYLVINHDSLADMTGPEITAFLSGHMLLYELATPQYIQVPGNQIMTQEGTNYIWTDCGDTITAAYVAVK